MSLCSFFCKTRVLPQFVVTVHLGGQHPYRDEPEFQGVSRDVVVTVRAKNWNKAERAAIDEIVRTERNWWSASVKNIEWKGL